MSLHDAEMDDSSDEMTVVYKLEPVDENEAAFLPRDLPEVVLDPTRVIASSRDVSVAGGGVARSVVAESVATLPIGRPRPSNYSEYSYSPQIEYLPTGSLRRAGASTINRTTSVDEIHYLHQRNKYRRLQAPAYTAATKKYGSEFGGGSRYAPSDVYATQVRRGYVVPYRPVYVKPAPPASLSRASDISRVYRQPSNADSYTLSRPPGRAQPIKLQNGAQQPINGQRHISEVTAERILHSEPPDLSRHHNDVINRASQQKQLNGDSQDVRHISDSQYVIEAALEPAGVHGPQNPHSSRASRTHIRDIQYEQGKAAGGDRVEISPVNSEDGEDPAMWQDVSLYVRRPSLEDVHRVDVTRVASNTSSRQRPLKYSNGSYGMRMDSGGKVMVSHNNARNQASATPPTNNAATQTTTAPEVIMMNGNVDNRNGVGNSGSHVISNYTYTSEYSTGSRQNVPSGGASVVVSNGSGPVRQFSITSDGSSTGPRRQHSNASSVSSGAANRKFMVRTTIPTAPPPGEQRRSSPVIHVSDEAMHF